MEIINYRNTGTKILGHVSTNESTGWLGPAVLRSYDDAAMGLDLVQES